MAKGLKKRPSALKKRPTAVKKRLSALKNVRGPSEPPRNEALPFKSLLSKFLAPVHAPNEKRLRLETGWLETGWLASASSHKV